MKRILLILAITIATTALSQSKANLSIENVPDKCECGCFLDVVGLIDFQGNQDPIITFGCSDYPSLTIERIEVGLYILYLANGDLFNQDRTFLQFQSESSLWREIQAKVEVDGKIYINAYQNGVHTDIVTQNSSFRVMGL